MRVQVTEFRLPHGASHTVMSDELPDELKPQVELIYSCACRFTAEVLMTGKVSLTIEHEEGDFNIAIFTNEPGAPIKALETMIRDFKKEDFDKWLYLVQS